MHIFGTNRVKKTLVQFEAMSVENDVAVPDLVLMGLVVPGSSILKIQ